MKLSESSGSSWSSLRMVNWHHHTGRRPTKPLLFLSTLHYQTPISWGEWLEQSISTVFLRMMLLSIIAQPDLLTALLISTVFLLISQSALRTLALVFAFCEGLRYNSSIVCQSGCVSEVLSYHHEARPANHTTTSNTSHDSLDNFDILASFVVSPLWDSRLPRREEERLLPRRTQQFSCHLESFKLLCPLWTQLW